MNTKIIKKIEPLDPENLYLKMLLKDQTTYIDPREINGDIKLNIKQQYKKDTIGKCIEQGYILDVYSLIDIESVEDRKEDNENKIEYIFDANIKICAPLKGQIIPVICYLINDTIIVGKNGPLLFVETINDVSNLVFDYNLNKLFFKRKEKLLKNLDVIDKDPLFYLSNKDKKNEKKTEKNNENKKKYLKSLENRIKEGEQKQIEKDNYLNVFVEKSRFNQNEKSIIIYGRTIDFSSDEDVKKMFLEPIDFKI